MRLKSLEVSDFRGFAGCHRFDLHADVVIVVGTNGNGKTSLFDAILWALSGRIPRLGGKDAELVCRYSKTGQARVVLGLDSGEEHRDVIVTRTFDGEKSNVRVESTEGTFDGPGAEGKIIEVIWRDAATSADPGAALASVLTRCLYLQQDQVRQFIESATEQDRFAAVSELMGAGRISELQVELEKEKASWTRGTNSKFSELQPTRNRLAIIDARVAELRARPAADAVPTQEQWTEWWAGLEQIGVKSARVGMDSREAPSAVDTAIKGLDGLKRAAERRLQQVAALRADVEALGARPDTDATELGEMVARLTQQRETLREAIGAEQARVTELRRTQAEIREQSEQLRVLATLALQHLGERCPVCEQTYDVAATRRRLEVLASELNSGSEPAPVDVLSGFLAQLAAAETGLAGAEVQLRAREQAVRDWSAAEAAIASRFDALGLASAPSDQQAVLLASEAETRRQIGVITAAQGTGESLALRLSRAGEQATLLELEREGGELRARLHREDAELVRRTRSGELAQKVIEALREATSETVTERIREIEPLLGEMYSRIDVHPAFRVVKFLAEVVRGRGRLSTIVSDPVYSVECDVPALVLSSSQMNALAVCTFLSLNLGMARPPLETAILDDPLQSLDDINLLGLIDLMRRTKDQRQLCISTHDVRFGDLLARKLRPRSAAQRTTVIGLDGWSRKGPVVSVHDVGCDPSPMRLAAS